MTVVLSGEMLVCCGNQTCIFVTTEALHHAPHGWNRRQYRSNVSIQLQTLFRISPVEKYLCVRNQKNRVILV